MLPSGPIAETLRGRPSIGLVYNVAELSGIDSRPKLSVLSNKP